MNNRIEISKIDVKSFQVLSCFFTVILMLPLTAMLIFNFTLNTFQVFVCCLGISIAIDRTGRRTWNIWYEDGSLFFDNIYSKKVESISSFRSIEMTSVLGNNYTLHLDNEQSFNFRIKMTDDLKLYFKNDSQFYARAITKKLNDLKESQLD